MKYLCGFIILFLSSCSATQIRPPAPIPDTDYARGYYAGSQDYQTNPAWVLAGVGCGIFGVGAAAVIVPEPPPYKYMNESAEYAAGYTVGFKAKAKRENAKYALLGWATWIIAFVAIQQ